MSHHIHPNEQDVLWPHQRSDEQQAFIDEKDLDEIPNGLDHKTVFSASYIGIPGETSVYEITFSSNSLGTPSVCSEWMLSAQQQGWEVVEVYQGFTHYSSALRFRFRRLPLVGRLFGEDGLKIRIQREPDRSREQSSINEIPMTSQRSGDA